MKKEIPTTNINKEELETAKQQGQDLLQMYQAGYLDGFNKQKKHKATLKQCHKEIRKAFEMRFKKQVFEAIDKSINEKIQTE